MRMNSSKQKHEGKLFTLIDVSRWVGFIVLSFCCISETMPKAMADHNACSFLPGDACFIVSIEDSDLLRKERVLQSGSILVDDDFGIDLEWQFRLDLNKMPIDQWNALAKASEEMSAASQERLAMLYPSNAPIADLVLGYHYNEDWLNWSRLQTDVKHSVRGMSFPAIYRPSDLQRHQLIPPLAIEVSPFSTARVEEGKIQPLRTSFREARLLEDVIIVLVDDSELESKYFRGMPIEVQTIDSKGALQTITLSLGEVTKVLGFRMGDAMFVTDVSQMHPEEFRNGAILNYSGFLPAKRGEDDVEVLNGAEILKSELELRHLTPRQIDLVGESIAYFQEKQSELKLNALETSDVNEKIRRRRDWSTYGYPRIFLTAAGYDPSKLGLGFRYNRARDLLPDCRLGTLFRSSAFLDLEESIAHDLRSFIDPLPVQGLGYGRCWIDGEISIVVTGMESSQYAMNWSGRLPGIEYHVIDREKKTISR